VTPLAWGVMVVICGLVWGGFAALLTRASRAEARKGRGPEPDL
jgi:hypothetical protein